jgi:hypothetical protein
LCVEWDVAVLVDVADFDADLWVFLWVVPVVSDVWDVFGAA